MKNSKGKLKELSVGLEISLDENEYIRIEKIVVEKRDDKFETIIYFKFFNAGSLISSMKDSEKLDVFIKRFLS
jgi:hypothetical protein